VRTSKEKIPQLGITFLLIDMRTPGVEVKPIVMLSGEHIQNEVFFTDVRVPKKNVVGRVGEGWTVAKYLMQFERGGGVSAPGLKNRLENIRTIAKAEAMDNTFAAKIAQAAVDVASLEAVELRVMSKVSTGGAPGAESSMLKMVGTDLSQRLTELALEAVGIYAMPYQPFATSPGGPVPNYMPPSPNAVPAGPDYSWTVTPKYFNDRAGSIYAGTNEVQRNIMAKAILGL
jgi:alkylation response protein AidB-like acyl-CoA dehydrogenase